MKKMQRIKILLISRKISIAIIYILGFVILSTLIIYFYLLNIDKFAKISGMMGWDDPLYRFRQYYLNYLFLPMIIPSVIIIVFFTLLSYILSIKIKTQAPLNNEKEIKFYQKNEFLEFKRTQEFETLF
jgi:hypothetical protein